MLYWELLTFNSFSYFPLTILILSPTFHLLFLAILYKQYVLDKLIFADLKTINLPGTGGEPFMAF